MRAIYNYFLIFVLLLTTGGVALAGEAPGEADLAGPQAAPNPPFISIQRAGPSSIALLWEHGDQTTTAYQVWRSTDPYFDPNMGQGVKIDDYTFPGSLYGLGTEFRYVDDGVCGKYTAPASAPNTCRFSQNPPVTVIGDVAHNYFWAVRAGNSGDEFDFANRVGEFDFALVAGG